MKIKIIALFVVAFISTVSACAVAYEVIKMALISNMLAHISNLIDFIVLIVYLFP